MCRTSPRLVNDTELFLLEVQPFGVSHVLELLGLRNFYKKVQVLLEKLSLSYVSWIAQVVAALSLPPSAGAAAGALRGGAGPAADRRPLVLGAAVAQRQAEPGQQEEQGHLHLKWISFHFISGNPVTQLTDANN